MTIVNSILNAIFDHPFAQLKPEAATEAEAKPSVDIAAIMDELTSNRGERLEWRTSVVDLLKVLGLDSSFEARVRLAKELHYGGNPKNSAAMNDYLHEKILETIEMNGGHLPDDLK